ncbi:MAG: carbonic anhydrase family protein [Epsilonproteobacteria bacterium]|nr:carbonic anhydrase family protein [Campylobacterota bacterium]
MKKLLASLAISAMTAGTLMASNYAHGTWSYSGKTGPEYWGDLKKEYIMCKIGKNQSPIDVSGAVSATLTPLNIYYDVKAKTFLNNGHTVKAEMKDGAKLYIDGKEFKLLQFHFHTPSENTINGEYFPMEAHFVHSTKDGELAVVAVMFKIGKYNPALQKLVDNMPKKPGVKNNLCPANLKAKDLLPKSLEYYRFNGSLTTPPCSEGVRWFVLKQPVEVSEKQIKAFEKVMGKNNRPLQPINARVILK